MQKEIIYLIPELEALGDCLSVLTRCISFRLNDLLSLFATSHSGLFRGRLLLRNVLHETSCSGKAGEKE